ncbi:MAG: YhcH/YjgK/YiaL family protein [Bacteroidales bacterium]|jgi:YhcH/YjgK/YiaL family protein|nr:YhcH/YjgK/YiaL family protein [Bacteroidales bacterium]
MDMSGNYDQVKERSVGNKKVKGKKNKAMNLKNTPISSVSRMIEEQKVILKPDECINKEEFIKEYNNNPDLWNKAFKFLANTDLENLEPGRYEIVGNDLYASVDEYISKNIEVARFEAHRKYADIQYVISGEEQIGVIELNKAEITVPYNDTKDIMFLKAAQGTFSLATPMNFFIFFPEDAHCPGVKIAENSSVKKVVIKVRIK